MELTANELRIGNYLNYQGKIIKVEGIHNRTIYHSDRQFDQVGVEKYITFEPIPLTEEWLFKFGFEKDKYDYFHHIKSKIIIGHTTTDEFFEYEYLTGFQNSHTEMCELKYVHELQNLYYCLCGKELQINIKPN